MGERISLGSIAELKTGPFGTQLHANEYVAEGIPVINVRNIGYGEIIDNDLDMVSRETLSRLSEHTLKENDIVFGRKGSIDRHAFIDNRYDGWMQGSDCIRVRIHDNEINPKYVSHYLKLDSVKKQLINGAVGSTMPSMNTDILKSIVISVPSKEKQDAIEAVFSSIEQKIGINTSICSDLESMAKLLYDYWFVQFDFPDENGRPYKSSGGKMVWNEKLKKEIPEGWEVASIGSKCQCLLGGTPSRDKKEYWGGSINWINSGAVNEFRISSSTETITEKGLENTSTYLMPRNTTVLAITGATLGQVSILNISACANQSVVGILETKEVPTEFIYPSVVSSMKSLMNQQTGAAQPHVNKQDIMGMMFAFPPTNIMEEYVSAVKGLYETILERCLENQQLTSLRDFLLPMLMNGQVKVADNTNEE